MKILNKSIANSITLLNAMFGSLSLIYTLNGNYKIAAICILLAVVMDGMDGRIARRLDIISELGKQLDSLCDLVSFGVAPALLLYAQVMNNFSYDIGTLLFLFFILCGAFRLARFNILNLTHYFLGIPITFAGAIMALVSLQAQNIPDLVIGLISFALSVLMVSNIKIRSFK